MLQVGVLMYKWRDTRAVSRHRRLTRLAWLTLVILRSWRWPLAEVLGRSIVLPFLHGSWVVIRLGPWVDRMRW